MWESSQHSNDNNIRWSWLRAVEWATWPMFLSQPIVPVLLYFFSWPIVLGSVIVITLLWRAFIVPFWVSVGLAGAGPKFVKLKFLTIPLMAFLLWQRGETFVATIAVFWPIVGPLINLSSFLTLTPLGKASQIGLVQTRIQTAIGFQPTKQTQYEDADA